MPRFPSIPQLSIVVPVTDDVAAFESSLVSVLENRPERSEIIVPHNGSYNDPFDLSDEVRFVEAKDDGLVELVQQSAGQARGRYVHVVAEGVLATPNWSEPAIEKLDNPELGFVAPVIRQPQGHVLACGWTDTPHRLCHPVASGHPEAEPGETVRAIGAYLQASFWRRDLLRSMSKAFRGDLAQEANYAYGLLARHAGWRGSVATDSVMQFNASELPWDQSTLDRGRRLRAIQHQLRGGGWGTAITAGLRSATACLTGQIAISEAIGQATAPLADAEVELLLFVGETMSPDDYDATIRLPAQIAARRAA
ncbi:MAG: glycosyltransferase family 2 protein [Planctomycetota bacterium]